VPPRIYTRTGDDGTTGLADGTRLPKDHPRVAAYGEVDELNAAIGAAQSFCEDATSRERLTGIQADLFALGAQLSKSKPKQKTRLDEARLTDFEGWMDAWMAALPPMKGFILPAGSKAGALLHLARTVCRRAERAVLTLGRTETLPPMAVRYLNRLSDLLFVMARAENRASGEPQIDW
jgi:cob(I)alamin adenosyltransferase